MPQGEFFILMCVGVGFIILGIIGIIWGRHEEKSYFDTLAERPDLREFMAHWPERPQPGALRIGGWIAIAAGLLMLIAGIVLSLLAKSPA